MDVMLELAINFARGPNEASPYLPMVKAMAQMPDGREAHSGLLHTKNSSSEDLQDVHERFAARTGERQCEPERRETAETCKISRP